MADAAPPQANAWQREALGRLAAGLAHAFNNVLQDLVGHVEMAADHLPQGSPGRDSAEQAIDAAMRAAELTDQLLLYTRPPPAVADPTDVTALLQSVQWLLDRTVGNGTTVVLEVTADLPPVAVDAGQLQTALIHLALDASQAMAHGGTVRIVAHASDGHVVIVVAGIGQRIGADSSGSLPMVQAFVRDWGGTVRSDAAAGQVELRLPHV
jgi:signal transduction histidine kinase